MVISAMKKNKAQWRNTQDFLFQEIQDLSWDNIWEKKLNEVKEWKMCFVLLNTFYA